MNKLKPPQISDHSALVALAYSGELAESHILRSELSKIRAAYARYMAARGNTLTALAADLPEAVQKLLRHYYKTPPKEVRYIAEMRQAFDFKSCPMCGSLHSGTLDHIFPQTSFAVYCLFSWNLVPACKCNSRRGALIAGGAQGQRILHPYFDSCLAERVVVARFSDLGATPRVELSIALPTNHADYSAVAFHVESIVSKTTILGYIANRWVQMVRQPSLAVPEFRMNPSSREDVRDAIVAELDRTDRIREGRNNWDSVFLAGLAADAVVTWLFARMSADGRAPNAPLLPGAA